MVLMREVLSIPGVMWTLRAGASTAVARWPILDDCSMDPLGMWKILSDDCPILTKYLLSCFVPTLEVAPLSAAADGIEPSRTPHQRVSSSWRYGVVMLLADLALAMAANWDGVNWYVILAETRRVVQLLLPVVGSQDGISNKMQCCFCLDCPMEAER